MNNQIKNILFKGLLLAGLLIFLFRGGIRLLLFGWKLFLPMIAVTIVYFVGRQLLQKKKVSAKPENERVATGQPIIICPVCKQPRGSCPKCQ